MNKILIQPPYFGDIAHYTAMAKSDEIYFESADNFQKQTARNRTHIMGANGKLMLNIPLKHSRGGDRQLTRDIRIENNFPWQDLHWKSLCSAYRSSPYFEFFEDDYSEQYKKYDKNESHIINPFSLGTFRLYNAHDCHTTAIRHTILKHIPQKRLLCKSIVTSENKIFYEELKLKVKDLSI